MEENNLERPRRVRRSDRYKEDPEVAAAPEAEANGAPETIREAPEHRRETEAPAPEASGETPTEAALAEAAENRVPARARQMSADPYGAVSAVSAAAVRRPGVRPQGKPRPGLPPRPGAEERAPRERVGYAPGRMSESMLRQHREELREPSGEAVRERPGAMSGETFRGAGRERSAVRPREPVMQPAGRDTRVRAYPEDGYGKPAGKPAAAAYLEKGKKKSSRKALMIIAVLVLVLCGALAAGRFLLPEDNEIRQTLTRLTPFLESRKEEPLRSISFSVAGGQGAVAPTDVTFSVVTAKDVESIRLVDGEGQPVVTSIAQADNTADSVWIMTLHLAEGFEGMVRLQARRPGGSWQDTGDTARISVSPPAGALTAGEAGATAGLPLAEETPEITAEPTPEPTAATETEATAEPGPWEEPAENTAENTVAEPGPGEASGDTAADAAVWALPTEIPTVTPQPTATAAPTATPPLTAEAAAEGADPSLITTNNVYVGSKAQKEYARPAKDLIRMPVADEYTKKPMGVLTFRGDNFRRNAACGTVDSATGLAVAWTAETGSVRGVSTSYYGVGWTGQAAIVKWSKEVREKSNIEDEKKAVSGLKEVIVAGLDGSIRFLDLTDGRLTRNSIKLGYPLRGTPSVHSGGFPYMNVGQFARKMKVKTGKIGLRQYNLYTQKELTLVDGLDGKLHRAFNNIGSFETSSLIDRTSDTVITAGTNGLLYLHALNSEFDYQAGVYKMAASTTVLRSKIKGEKDALTAVESSLAAYDKYVFYADMAGVLRCVDTDTLKPVWAVNTGDAVMAAVALDLTADQRLNLYTANMLANRKSGAVQIRRYDALSGRNAWTVEIGVSKGKKETADVGAKASPVIGQNSLSGLVYFTVTGISAEGSAALGFPSQVASALLALDKETGRIAWAYGMKERTESSPVAVYSPAGEGWLIQCDESGVIHLLEGLTGRVINTLTLDGKIEASPAVYGDMMVISTTGKGDTYIYGIQILGSGRQPAAAAAEAPALPENPAGEAAADVPADPADDPAGPEDLPAGPEEPFEGQPGEDAAGIG
ncbi:MAG: PQQ-binding-like beta-propeller repeat protein [Clostridia bacterium]|nr:PQQ-binding-like beta-propeller repeat protein [Clostridia bacterium]